MNGAGGAIYNAGWNTVVNSSSIGSNTAAKGGGIANLGIMLLRGTAPWPTVYGNSATGVEGGGGIWIGSGGVAIEDGVQITYNNAEALGAVGGGVANHATLSIVGVPRAVHVDNNTASGSGGGVYADQNQTSLDFATVSNNTASTGSGGGLYIARGGLTLDHSTVSGNGAGSGDGGGLFISSLDDGTQTITRTTIDNNSSNRGGGIFVSGGTTGLVNVTVSSNTSDSFGGGLLVTAGSVFLNSVTVASNSAGIAEAANGAGGIGVGGGTVTLADTLIAGNSDRSSGGGSVDCSGTLASAGDNFVGVTAGCSVAADFTGDPMLGPLYAPDSNTLRTHALLVRSPAIDQGHVGGCTDRAGTLLDGDELSMARYGRCDIGAYEYEGSCGDAFLQSTAGENCDMTDLGTRDCAGLGFTSGTLGCTGACAYDTSGCVGAPDGGMLDAGTSDAGMPGTQDGGRGADDSGLPGPPDGGTGGCGCRVSTPARGRGAAFALAFVIVALGARRRSRNGS
jgi:MYXO-CTERM domain-containing protein